MERARGVRHKQPNCIFCVRLCIYERCATKAILSLLLVIIYIKHYLYSCILRFENTTVHFIRTNLFK